MERPRLGNLMILLSGVGLGLGVPAALAPWLSGWHWSIDLLACFAGQTLFGLSFVALLLLALRRWRSAGVAAAFTGLAAIAVVPTWSQPSWSQSLGPVPSSTAGSTTAVRLMCMNLLFDNDARAADVLAIVRSEAPDIVFCSEVTPAWLAALQPGLRDYPYQCVQVDSGCFGVALFSRLSLAQATVIPLGYGWAPAVRATVRVAGRPLGLLGVHTPRPGDRQRGVERDRALLAIAAALAPLPETRAVLGDFNATPWNHAFVEMLAATGLRRASAGALATTWPGHLPAPLRIAIDHVLSTPDLAGANLSIGQSFGSDHRPLAVSLTFAPR